MLSNLAEYADLFGPLRLFRYLTFRGLMGATTAMLLGLLIGPAVIRALRRLKLAQTIRGKEEVGKLAEVQLDKTGTPTMGGIIIYISVMISALLWARLNVYVIAALGIFTGLALLGFADDYMKVSKKNTKGLSSFRKLLGQGLLTFAAVSWLLLNKESHLQMSQLWLPFFKSPVLEMMPVVLVMLLFFCVMAGSSNAINLTDGLDGLAIGCTITVTLVFGIIAYAAGHALIAEYLFISYIPGIGELAVVSTCVLGAGIAFLWYNAHPAEVFMGDTGSLALGGLIGAIAFMTHQPFTLVIVGGIFVIEAVSVLLQVASFRMTGKRIFRMAPLHHHFQLKGWPETKVVIRFWVLSLVCALAGLATLKLR